MNSVTPVTINGKHEHYDFVPPVMEFCINGKTLIAISPYQFDKLTEDETKERLLFAAPAVAERILNDLYNQNGNWDFSFKYNPISLEPDKEKVAGETYQQRSHLCYEDLCNYLVEIWQEPLNSSLWIESYKFVQRCNNRRIYETEEICKAFTWAKGYGYLTKLDQTINPQNTASREITGASALINDTKIQELEAKLARDELGALPQIAGSINTTKDFSFIPDPGLRDMLTRDCREINQAAKVGAAKSVILLCGSMIETLLYGMLIENEQAAQAKAGELAEKPELDWIQGKLKNCQNRSLNKWEAIEMIIVAHSLFPDKVSDDARQYAMVLKNYRNLIHPGKEEREDFSLNQHTASIAISVVNLILDKL